MSRIKDYLHRSPTGVHVLLALVVVGLQYNSVLINFIPVTLMAFLSVYWIQIRKIILLFMCIWSAILIGYPYIDIPTPIRIVSVLIFFIITKIFTHYIFEKFYFFRKHYFLSLLAAYILVILGIFYFFKSDAKTTRSFTEYFAMTLVGFWFLCDFVRSYIQQRNNLSVVWVRPFWSSWIVPYDSPAMWSTYIQNPVPKSEMNDEIARSIKVFFKVIALVFIFENIFFENPLITYNLKKSFFSFPITYRDGFRMLLKDHTRGEIFTIQFLTVIHFLAFNYVYSTLSILCGQIAGFKIRPHVLEFWKADKFAEFYFRSTFHYSRLIKTHVIEAFLNLKLLKKLGVFRNAVLIFLAVFITGEISMYIGRGLFLNTQLSFDIRNNLFLESYHYAFLMALFCALSVLYNSMGFKVKLPQKIRLVFYISLSSFALVFGFHYLLTPLEVKYEIIKRFIE